MDADGIWLQVLYPSVTLGGAKVYGDEPELQQACVGAYNDWIVEFCEGSDGRLVAQAILPTTGVDAAIAETERAIELGHRGVVISAFPNGTLDAAPEDDRFWAFAQEADIPVAVHIGSFLKTVASVPPLDSLAFMGVAGASKAGAHTLPVVCDLIFSGIFERFPRLKLLLVEANIGWIPTCSSRSTTCTCATDGSRTVSSRCRRRRAARSIGTSGRRSWSTPSASSCATG